MIETRRQFRIANLCQSGVMLALLVLASVPVPGQTMTASIRGIVRSETDPIPGATVEARNRASGFVHRATSAEGGSFALYGLDPGVYEITVSSEAFEAQTRTVQVLIGHMVRADFRLTVDAVFTENVTVFGDEIELLIDSRSPEISTNVTLEQIESLPQNSRNFLSFASLAPGVAFPDNEEAVGKKFRGSGQDSRQVNVFVDGLSYKNDLLQGGAFMQDSSRGNPFPQNAVQEYRVLTQNYKAEYEKASAAIISAVTKSGGNSLSGSAFYSFQDRGLVEQDDFSKERGEDKPAYSRDQFGLSLGGPLVRDRAHFFVSYEGNRQDFNATVLRGPDFENAPTNVQDSLGSFETGTLTSPFESDLLFGKVSWQPADTQTVNASLHLRDEKEIRGFGGQRTRDGAESFQIGTDVAAVKHTWVLGNGLNEAAVTYQKLRWNPTALEATTPRRNYFGILDVGGKDASQDFEQKRTGVRDDFTLLASWKGRHTLKTGVSASFLDYSITKSLFENGLFEFRSDEQWQFPFQARVGVGDPSLAFSNEQYGVYFQDDWEALENLTFSLGVRWDYESNMLNNDYRTPPDLVAAMRSACRDYSEPVGGQTTWCLSDFLDFSRFTTDGNDRSSYDGMVQPRVGFTWDPTKSGKTVLFGGWGKYFDRVILNDIFDEAYRQQFKIFAFCFSEDGGPAPNCSVPALQWRPEFESGEALLGLVASGQAPGPEVFLIDNEMRPPRSTQSTLGVRQQIGQWLVGLSYASVRGFNGLIYFFADLPPGSEFENRFGGNVPVDGFARLFSASTARRSKYDAVYLTADKPMAGSRWGFNLAYTYADAEQMGTDNPGEGLTFGAFDYLNADDLFFFPASNVHEHRLVMSGIVRLPAGFQASTLITLASGLPYTIFDDSTPPFTVRWNQGQPRKQDFIIPDAFAYRSVDLRLEWQAPQVGGVDITLIGEAFNLFDFDNYGSFQSFRPRLPNINEAFGDPTSEFNTRRFNLGARITF